VKFLAQVAQMSKLDRLIVIHSTSSSFFILGMLFSHCDDANTSHCASAKKQEEDS
jgi:hypothetical protein